MHDMYCKHCRWNRCHGIAFPLPGKPGQYRILLHCILHSSLKLSDHTHTQYTQTTHCNYVSFSIPRSSSKSGTVNWNTLTSDPFPNHKCKQPSTQSHTAELFRSVKYQSRVPQHKTGMLLSCYSIEENLTFDQSCGFDICLTKVDVSTGLGVHLHFQKPLYVNF